MPHIYTEDDLNNFRYELDELIATPWYVEVNPARIYWLVVEIAAAERQLAEGNQDDD